MKKYLAPKEEDKSPSPSDFLKTLLPPKKIKQEESRQITFSDEEAEGSPQQEKQPTKKDGKKELQSKAPRVESVAGTQPQSKPKKKLLAPKTDEDGYEFYSVASGLQQGVIW
jgi:hypothetical protein